MILSFFKVSGHSMEPYLKEGNVVAAIKFLPLKPRDVVVFQHHDKKMVKRIKEIKKDLVYVAGDNKDDSMDSKIIGWIHKKDIVGRVVFKI